MTSILEYVNCVRKVRGSVKVKVYIKITWDGNSYPLNENNKENFQNRIDQKFKDKIRKASEVQD